MPDDNNDQNDDQQDDQQDQNNDDQNQDQGEQLRAEGKRALEEERAARKKAERDAKAARAEADKLKSQGQSEQEKAIATAKAEGAAEALKVANARILKAEVKAAAAGKLADPADAVRLLDLSEFEVDDDGDVDSKAIGKAIDQLVKEKPYLAGNGGGTGRGSADQGARGGGGSKPDMNAWLRGEKASI